MKRKLNFRLYLISDRKQTQRRSLEEVVESAAAVASGQLAFQLREKDLSAKEVLAMAYRFRALTRKYHVDLFINDRVDIALAAGADGVHLTTQSMPTAAVRSIGQDKLMIGVSTHTLEEAKEAVAGGADFVVLGPVYDTPSKMQYGPPVGLSRLSEVCRSVNIPVFALGGINTVRQIKETRQAGAYGVAMISAIIAAPDVQTITAEFLQALEINDDSN